MKAFILPAGTRGEIMTLDSNSNRCWRQYTTSEEHMFFEEDFDFDPITQHNTGQPHKSSWEGILAAEGMAGILRKGNKSGGMYLFVFPYSKLSVH